jgi:hypothetical protein
VGDSLFHPPMAQTGKDIDAVHMVVRAILQMLAPD